MRNVLTLPTKRRNASAGKFLLVAAPLAVDTATGSPLNPLAIF